MVATGGNPYKTASGQNLVKDLITKYQGNNGLYGIVNQHSWSVIALNAANAEGVYNAGNPVKLAAASYDGGKLHAMKIFDCTESGTISDVNLSLPADITSAYVKIMVWQDLENIMPICPPKVIEP